MEKLLLHYLMQGRINPSSIKLEWLENPLAFIIIQTFLKASKRGHVPTHDDLMALLKAKVSNKEFLKVSAYIDAVKNIDTTIEPDEVVMSLKTNYSLAQSASIVEEIAEAAVSKDVGLLTEKTQELRSVVSSATPKKVAKMGEEIDNNIFMVESFLPTLNKTGNRLCGLTIVGAESGGGKSVFCVNEVISQWRKGNDSLYFSLELPAKLLEARILSNMAEIPIEAILADLLPEDIRKPLTSEQQRRIAEIKAEMASPDTPTIYIIDNMFTPEDIENTVIEYAQEHNVKLFVLDYLNLMSVRTGADGSSWASKANFTKKLNQLCLEYQIVVVCPTQIDITKGTDGKLRMETKGTKELLNTASLALLLYRPEGSSGLIQLTVTKARNAQPCELALADELHIQRFTDLGEI